MSTAKILSLTTPIIAAAAFGAGVHLAVPKAEQPVAQNGVKAKASTVEKVVNVPIFEAGDRLGYCAFELEVTTSKDDATKAVSAADWVFAKAGMMNGEAWNDAACERLADGMPQLVAVNESVFVAVLN